MASIGLQLYSVREQLAADFEGAIRRIAAMGYAGVEGAGMYGESPEYAANLFSEVGLEVPSLHVRSPFLENYPATIEVAKTLGAPRVVCPWYPPERFRTVEDIRGVCGELNAANQTIRAAGLELHYHNHWQECELVHGKPAYQYMLEFLDANIGWELDVYWAQAAGLDPIEVVKQLGKRAPLLHLKDGPAQRDVPMTALGDGIVNIPGIAKASRAHGEWWIVELDECATDMPQAVEKSFRYLEREGLVHG